MLPSYTRLGGTNGVGGGGGISTSSIGPIGGQSTAATFVRRLFRSRQRCLMVLVFVTLVCICFGGVFYLPDDFGAGERVLKVYKHLQKAGPEMFIPAPPLMGHQHGHPHPDGGGAAVAGDGFADGAPPPANSGVLEPPYVRRAIGDRAKLNAKIEEEFGREQRLEKPDGAEVVVGGGGEAPLMRAPPAGTSERQLREQQQREQQQAAAVGAAPDAVDAVQQETSPASTGFVDGQDKDPIVREQRNKVKEVSLWAIMLNRVSSNSAYADVEFDRSNDISYDYSLA